MEWAEEMSNWKRKKLMEKSPQRNEAVTSPYHRSRLHTPQPNRSAAEIPPWRTNPSICVFESKNRGIAIPHSAIGNPKWYVDLLAGFVAQDSILRHGRARAGAEAG